MTNTEELCSMLDERGVKYERSAWSSGAAIWWRGRDGVLWRAHDNDEDELLSLYAWSSVTPAQAVEATLGAGTCHIEPVKDYKVSKYVTSWGCVCSSCGGFHEFTHGKGWKFCPSCGKRIVWEVDE